MTIGDILAVIAAVLLAGASWGAAVLTTRLLAPAAVVRAQHSILARPWLCAGRGTAAIASLLPVALIIAGRIGPFRLFVIPVIGLIAVAAAIGSAGIVQSMADRIDSIGADGSPFARLSRATALYVGVGFVPVVGWFFMLPAALLLSTGAGIAALWHLDLGRSTPTALPDPNLSSGSPA